jgi:hypothetical protein
MDSSLVGAAEEAVFGWAKEEVPGRSDVAIPSVGGAADGLAGLRCVMRKNQRVVKPAQLLGAGTARRHRSCSPEGSAMFDGKLLRYNV